MIPFHIKLGNAGQVCIWLVDSLQCGFQNSGCCNDVCDVGSRKRCPHFMMEVIQNDSSNFILLLDLLPRKCLVFNPDYLKTFYEDTELENYWQLIENAPQS